MLENLARNALEAASPGEIVTLGCARIFQRSFSTKGPGRSLETYSVKLLTEKFLNGRAAFSTAEAEGTTFTVWCPEDIPD